MLGVPGSPALYGVASHPPATQKEREMAAYSTMLELGTPLPAFTLPNTSGPSTVSSATLKDGVSVVAFLCNHCPYVKHIQRELAVFGRDCTARGVKLVGISSNDVATHPRS